MILFLDTETQGLPDFNLRARDPAQPHIVQMAAILCREDGAPVEEHNVIIKPDGWNIPAEASNVHGITDEIAQIGISEKLAVEILLAMLKKSSLLVGHNIQFDKFIARIAMRRFELITDDEDAWWKSIPTFCTMRKMTDLCKLPGKIEGKFKWPNLKEAYSHAFKSELENAHDAMADLRACKSLYYWLTSGQERAS